MVQFRFGYEEKMSVRNDSLKTHELTCFYMRGILHGAVVFLGKYPH